MPLQASCHQWTIGNMLLGHLKARVRHHHRVCHLPSAVMLGLLITGPVAVGSFIVDIARQWVWSRARALQRCRQLNASMPDRALSIARFAPGLVNLAIALGTPANAAVASTGVAQNCRAADRLLHRPHSCHLAMARSRAKRQIFPFPELTRVRAYSGQIYLRAPSQASAFVAITWHQT